MVRWAIVTNDRLRSEFDLRQILGWGGCGAVVGGYRRSDRQKVCLIGQFEGRPQYNSIYNYMRSYGFLDCFEIYLQEEKQPHHKQYSTRN